MFSNKIANNQDETNKELGLSGTLAVKKHFETARTKIRTHQIKNDQFEEYVVSNDYFSMAEVLPNIQEKKTEPTKPLVNICVAEADIFSAIHKLEGDVIICDINQDLLNFIEQQAAFLLKIYNQECTNGHLNFDNVIKKYDRWWKQQRPDLYDVFSYRKELLDSEHFLYNENNFRRAMEALKAKKLTTLNINLFDKKEQDAFIAALNQADVHVKMVNLTNLPDYDEKESLPDFLEKLPWAQDPFILWNIHDIGPTSENKLYRHYLFSADNTATYRKHVIDRPRLWAEIDALSLHQEKESTRLSTLRRYTGNSHFKELANENRRKIYLEHFQKQLKLFKENESLSFQKIAQRYQIQYPPRDCYTQSSFKTLNIMQCQLLEKKRFVTSNILSEEQRRDLIALIDPCLEKIKNSRKEIDFSLSGNSRMALSELDKKIKQIDFLLEWVKAADTIRNLMKIQFNQPEDKPTRQKVEDFLKMTYEKALKKTAEQLDYRPRLPFFMDTIISAIEYFNNDLNAIDIIYQGAAPFGVDPYSQIYVGLREGKDKFVETLIQLGVGSDEETLKSLIWYNKIYLCEKLFDKNPQVASIFYLYKTSRDGQDAICDLILKTLLNKKRIYTYDINELLIGALQRNDLKLAKKIINAGGDCKYALDWILDNNQFDIFENALRITEIRQRFFQESVRVNEKLNELAKKGKTEYVLQLMAQGIFYTPINHVSPHDRCVNLMKKYAEVCAIMKKKDASYSKLFDKENSSMEERVIKFLDASGHKRFFFSSIDPIVAELKKDNKQIEDKIFQEIKVELNKNIPNTSYLARLLFAQKKLEQARVPQQLTLSSCRYTLSPLPQE